MGKIFGGLKTFEGEQWGGEKNALNEGPEYQ